MHCQQVGNCQQVGKCLLVDPVAEPCCGVCVLQVPFGIVFTKCDARKKGEPTPAANMKAFKTELLKVKQA
jgi:hypothetical protein